MESSENELNKVAEATKSQAKKSRQDEPTTFEAFEIGSDSDAESIQSNACARNESPTIEPLKNENSESAAEFNPLK